MFAQNFTPNAHAGSMSQLAAFFRPTSDRTIINSPHYRLCTQQAKAMADELVASLRVLDQEVKSSIDLHAMNMAKGKGARVAFKRIRELMLSQLAAVELDKESTARSTVYFIEVGVEGDDMLYLCRSSCSRSAPFDSWFSERLLSLGSHALLRAFMHRCAWASGYAVTTESVLSHICRLYFSYRHYVELQGGEFVRLAQQGWLALCSIDDACLIVKHDQDGLPHIHTVFANKTASKLAGEFSMIPPKGRFALPRCAIKMNLADLTF
jgi:hypothetical protein